MSTQTQYSVIRGGGWYSVDPARVRARVRDGDGPAYCGDGLGVRCAVRV